MSRPARGPGLPPVRRAKDGIGAPRYHQVYVTVRAWVQDGTYKPGAQIPTEPELGRIFGVSRITIRKAIDALVREGWLVRRQGRGTFARFPGGSRPVSIDMGSVLAQVSDLAALTGVRDRVVAEVDPDEETRAALALAAGALIAGAVSCLRTVAIVFFIASDVAWLLVLPLGVAALGMTLAGLALARRANAAGPPAAPPENPFELAAVLKIALLLAAVALASRLAAEKLGSAAVLAVAALTGLADVDAVALSVPLLAPATLSLQTAAQAVLAAVGVNICAKAAYALVLGGGRFGTVYAALSVAAGTAGAAIHFLI